MPAYVWILIWAVLIGGVALLAIREIRSGRKITADVDRMKHEAAREAGIRADTRGPGAASGGFGM